MSASGGKGQLNSVASSDSSGGADVVKVHGKGDGGPDIWEQLAGLQRKLKTPTGQAMLAGFVALLAWALRKLRIHLAAGGRFVDTRFAGWLIENSAAWLLCSLRAWMPQTRRVNREDPWRKQLGDLLYNMALCLVGGVVVEEGAVGIHHLVETRLYSHVKYFRPAARDPNPFTKEGWENWCYGNGKGQLLGAVFQSLVEAGISDQSWHDLTTQRFNVKDFFAKIAIFRVFMDLTFYLAHRIMHVYPWIYQNVHKRHHTHFSTNLPTNYRFTMIDVLGESAVPIGVAMMVVKAFGYKIGRFESNLFVSYTSWHESGTHTGKPIPTISLYPPLSPLYNALFPAIDDRAIEFHETHHNRIRCNYGITPWIDALMGTMIMGEKAKDV